MRSIQLQAFHHHTQQQQLGKVQCAVQRSPIHRLHFPASYKHGRAAWKDCSQAKRDRTACNSNKADPGATPPSVESAINSSTNAVSSKETHVRVFNPLELLFGKAWRKAVPLSILFFSATYIFTMLQVGHLLGPTCLS